MFIWILFSHIIADFFFQPKDLAFYKKQEPVLCAIHCTIYTFVLSCIIAFGTDLKWWQPILVFITHFIVDAFPVVEKWCEWMRIRTWYSEVNFDSLPPTKEEVVHISFGSLVYVVLDNTLHLLSLLLIFGG